MGFDGVLLARIRSESQGKYQFIVNEMFGCAKLMEIPGAVRLCRNHELQKKLAHLSIHGKEKIFSFPTVTIIKNDLCRAQTAEVNILPVFPRISTTLALVPTSSMIWFGCLEIISKY